MVKYPGTDLNFPSDWPTDVIQKGKRGYAVVQGKPVLMVFPEESDTALLERTKRILLSAWGQKTGSNQEDEVQIE